VGAECDAVDVRKDGTIGEEGDDVVEHFEGGEVEAGRIDGVLDRAREAAVRSAAGEGT
jgi:hypothetical protein